MNNNRQFVTNNRRMINPQNNRQVLNLNANGNGNGNEVIESPALPAIQTEIDPEIASFLSVLSQNPDERQIRTNQYANNSEYLPIQFLEELLDKVFGLWNLKHKQTQCIGNAICTDVELEVCVGGTWIVRAGSGSCQVQTDPQTGEFKPKSIEKAYGASLSMAFKNAAKRLGNLFGRNLNRDEVVDYYQSNYGNNNPKFAQK